MDQDTFVEFTGRDQLSDPLNGLLKNGAPVSLRSALVPLDAVSGSRCLQR